MSIASADLERIDLTDHDRYAHAVPYADFDRLRREDPVHWHPERSGSGFWAVTKYHDVVAVSRDTATYSSEAGAVALEDLEPDAIEARKSMIDTDPPRHAELRRLVTADFTRRRVALRADEVSEIVRTILAQTVRAGTFDAVERIATAVPIRVLLRILGIPRADEDLMIKLGDRIIAGTDPDLGDDVTGDDRYRLLPFRSPAALEMREYSAWFRAAARQRGDDTSLLARLAGAQIGGEPLRQADYDAMFLLLVVAGNETTRSALALGIEALGPAPGAVAPACAGARTWTSATEEILRWATPLHHFRRTATRDAALHGRHHRGRRQGRRLVHLGQQGRATSSLTRTGSTWPGTPDPQISFGLGGPHRCLGEHLARLEIKVVLAELLRQVRRLELAGSPRRIRSNFTNGLKSLPVYVEPSSLTRGSLWQSSRHRSCRSCLPRRERGPPSMSPRPATPGTGTVPTPIPRSADRTRHPARCSTPWAP